jgi:hypothetical protein
MSETEHAHHHTSPHSWKYRSVNAYREIGALPQPPNKAAL